MVGASLSSSNNDQNNTVDENKTEGELIKKGVCKENQIDDDSENDGDYDPTEDKEDDSVDNNFEGMVVEKEEDEFRLPLSQLKAVDEAFEELFGYPWGTRFSMSKKKKQQRNAALTPRERILINMFGPSGAARFLQKNPSTAAQINNKNWFRQRQVVKTTPKQTLQPVKMAHQATAASEATRSVSQQQHSNNLPHQYEQKMYAGKMIQVAKTTTSAAPITGPTKPAAVGIDKVLQKLAGPSKITTIGKTSADWDQFKIQTGLEKELEEKAKGKDAYLVKQDFLTRVDHRKFELERNERDIERAKRGK